MGNPYPALITDANSETRIAGQIDFTDAGNQPGAAVPAVQVMGPYTVNYNTPGLTDAYVLLDTLTANTLVIHAAVVVTQDWDAPATFEVTFDPDSSNWSLWGGANLQGITVGTGVYPGPTNGTYAGILTAGAKVACDAFGASGLGSGQVKVFLLVFPLT